ncbi:9-O-acetylesterase [Pedobacter sp. HMF7647]|uniref:9-O-acetylesterase n=1 Tax=Hufsiella arboris TaxID=2695275 RepID=A0A7K1Y9B7_9SPHI|nr:sialate O-acetylesterase [Hufsiella arboris]MXV51177.1 9-O-acetylesterase [Hufsiella arboris]
MNLKYSSGLLSSFVVIATFSIYQTAEAKVKLPSVFSDNMVFQQKTQAAIWGKDDPGKTITIIPSWDKKKYTVKTDASGNFKQKIQTPSYGGPYTISINDGEDLTLKNVLIGEVWVCSGQSNMEMPLAGWGKVNNYEDEIAKANYPNIRLLQAIRKTSNFPLDDVEVRNTGWDECSPASVADFSSVAYFFARELYKETKIPIGLIHTSWGGTIAEAWTSAATLKTMPDFKDAVVKIESSSKDQAELKRKYQADLAKWQADMVGKDAGYREGKAIWLDNQSSNDWKTMAVPGLWEEKALPSFDGVVWMKKKISIPQSWVGKEIQLSLGTIDDDDITWINDTKVGQTVGVSVPRKYTIAANTLKAGDNTITVRVFDSGGGGGFFGDEKSLALINPDGERISLAGQWQYHVGVDVKDVGAAPTVVDGPNRPTVLYNAMIHPFLNFAIKGAIWYQGESNAGRAYQYRELFPAMIKDWRKNWNEPDFPFYFVQLANYQKRGEQPGESDWAELREAQSKTLALPNTGMASAIDIGDAGDIHPKNKQEVGRRLALIALAKNYGKKITYSGPVYTTHQVAGNTIKLSFTHTDSGLKSTTGSSLKGFEIAGDDHKFVWADAKIVGNQVIVSSPQVSKPTAVRYGWANNPEVSLTNASGLPASPFRTDDWKGITYSAK